METCRKDVLANAMDDGERAAFATALRKLLYAAEDAMQDEA